jgi:TM2 domain-containing membrane protein YozV
MSEMSQRPQAGIALLLNVFLGMFGADKFYIGRTDLGILQIILTLTLIGWLINIPWIMLCSLSLLILIFGGGSAFMYSGVQWAEITSTDKVIAGVVLFVLVVSYMSKKIRENYKDKSSSCSSCNNTKENYSSCSACSGRRMLPPR